MREYHFLISSLPELSFEKKSLPFTLDFFYKELEYYLHPIDYKTVCYLRCETDSYNLLNLLAENDKPFKTDGNFTREELETEIKSPNKLPQCLSNFIDYYTKSNKSKNYASLEKQLFNMHYNYLINSENLFIRKWFSFDLNIKNILAHVVSELLETNPGDEMIGDQAAIDEILFYRSKNFDLNHRIPNYKKFLQLINQKDILEKEKQIDKFKWDYLDEITLFNYFTLEVILSYIIKLKIIQRWEEMDAEKGMSQLNTFINELQNPISI